MNFALDERKSMAAADSARSRDWLPIEEYPEIIASSVSVAHFQSNLSSLNYERPETHCILIYSHMHFVPNDNLLFWHREC